MKLLGRILGQKKILAVVLAAMVTVGLIAPAIPAAASPSDSVVITPSGTNLLPGASVHIDLVVNTVTSTSGYQANVAYDATKLNFVSLSYGNYMSTGSSATAYTVDTTNGLVEALNKAINGGSTGAQTNAIMATINFTVKSNAPVGDAAFSFYSYANKPTGAPDTTVDTELVDSTTNVISDATFTNATIHIIHPAPPAISNFTPTSAANGEVVTINGSNFTGATVIIGGVAANVLTNTGSVITARVGYATSGSVIVTNTLNDSDTQTGFTYIIGTIGAVSPATNVVSGATLTIAGRGLYNASTVTFKNGSTTIGTATPTSNAGGTSLSVTVPSLGTSNISAVAVVVNTPDGNMTASNTFAYQGATISGLTPTTGYSGDTILISGNGFGTGTNIATAVKFGGTNAQSFTVLSDTTILAVVAGGTTGPVTVTLADGTTVLTTAGNSAVGETVGSTTGNFIYENVSISVSPASQSPAADGTFTATVVINTKPATTTATTVNKEIRGWQGTLNFNPTRVQVVSVSEGTEATPNTGFFDAFLTTFNAGTGITAGTINTPSAPVIDNANGKVNVNYYIQGALDSTGVAKGATGSATLLTVHFRAIPNAPGASSLTLSNVVLANDNGDAVPGVVLAGGSVTLSGTGNIVTTDAGQAIDSNLGAQLTLIAPVSITGWNLVVSANNNVQRTLNVFANTSWQVTVRDNNATTAGYMTKYDGTNYTSATKLSSPLSLSSDAGNGGTGASVSLNNGGVLATGTAIGQNAANGGDIRNVMFNQPVTYTDPIVGSPYSYHIVVTFTASNTSY